MKSIRIASRGSRLALAQANLVKASLEAQYPDIEVSIVIITTTGDRDPSDFLYKSQSVGVFTTEVENALLYGRADLAVHSFKDLPTAVTPGLLVAAVPPRESPADVIVASQPLDSLKDLPVGAVVGTSSLRRIAQLLLLRPDLQCVPLRGNVETRLTKVEKGVVDAAVLACAGLNRLGFSQKISLKLAPEEFIPAPAQGALALQVRADDQELLNGLASLDHRETRIAVEAERTILATMRGGCSIPLGVYASIENDIIHIHAILSELDGKKTIRKTLCGAVEKSQGLAREAAFYLLDQGGREMLDQMRFKDKDAGA